MIHAFLKIYIFNMWTIFKVFIEFFGLPWWLSGKESTFQCRRCKLDPWIEKISWRRKWQPLQYSCLENPMDRGAWWATVHGVTRELDMTEQLNNNNNKLTLLQYSFCFMFRVFFFFFSCKPYEILAPQPGISNLHPLH